MVHPDHVLVKTSTDNNLGRQREEVPGAYTLLR